MMSVEVNMCSCCKDVWNLANLETINFDKGKLRLCPDCYKEWLGLLKRAYTDGQKNPSKKFKNWLHG